MEEPKLSARLLAYILIALQMPNTPPTTPTMTIPPTTDSDCAIYTCKF